MIAPADVVATDEALVAALAATDLVRVDEAALDALADELVPPAADGREPAAALVAALPPVGDGDAGDARAERILRGLVVVNAINYCFWPAEDEVAWSWRGERGFRGLLGLAASEAAANGGRLTAERLRAALFREGVVEGLQLKDERDRHLVELAEIVDVDLVATRAELGNDAAAFVAWLADRCPGFVDRASLAGHDLPMFKRAWLVTLLAQQLAERLPARAFVGAERALAIDYRLPQTLRDAGVLRYRVDLARAVDAGRMLVDREHEAAIRVAGAVAFRRLLARRADLDAAALDRALWSRARRATRPHHRFRTTAY